MKKLLCYLFGHRWDKRPVKWNGRDFVGCCKNCGNGIVRDYDGLWHELP